MPKLTGLLREIFPSARDYRAWLVRPFLLYTIQLKGLIMSALDDLNAKIDGLQASADAANTKADALIAGNAGGFRPDHRSAGSGRRAASRWRRIR